MAFFQYGKKTDTSKSCALNQIPLFSDLSGGELKAVEKRSRLVEFHKGEKVYGQGDLPDAFYVVLSGRFQVLHKKSDGGEDKVVNLYRNDYFGEISLLTNQPHSVSVKALNDALAIRIDRDDFAKILLEVPSLSLHLSRLLGRRLKERDERRAVEHAEIASVYSVRIAIGKTTMITNLAVAIHTELKRRVMVVNMNPPGSGEKPLQGSLLIENLENRYLDALDKYIFHNKVGFDYVNVFQEKIGSEATERKITSLLTFLLSRYQFVLVDLPQEIPGLAYKVLSQSDVVYLLTDDDTDNLEKCRALSKELKESFHFKDEQIKLLMIEESGKARLTMIQRRHIAGQRVFAAIPFIPELKDAPASQDAPYILRAPKSHYAKTIRYLARDLGNALVGLVLSSGAAFGLAHIGVLKVLEKENIPIDVVAGSSIGSLIGAFWAGGMSAGEMEELALSFNAKNSFFRLIGFGDVMLPHWGIFKGNQIEHFMRQFLGQKTFEDLNTPLRIVATNLGTSEPEVFEEGDVVKAIRASCSIPGIFRAVRHGNKIMVDGGIADPLPVGVLSRMGVKKIIAVNVLSGPRHHTDRKEVFRRRRELLEEQTRSKSTWRRFLFDMERKFASSQVDNIFNVLMSTIQFMEYSIASSAEIGADVVIRPVVIDSHWAEFYSGGKFVKMGEQQTQEAMKEIRALLEA
ncbi:MAG: patatin-like phospholipase family protein [Candidatus Omnitrophica bacterium]|nr:patatin-like phospholipase family protein [Candidatus Omnitrophota bacterium]